MIRFLHHQLDPSSRLIRLMCAEYSLVLSMEQISPFKREAEFTAISPAATLPVLIEDDEAPVVGPLANIHFIEQKHAPASVAGLIPSEAEAGAEMWRLLEWVLFKLNDEVTRYVVEEKLGKHERGQGAPESSVLRAAKANLAEHLLYFDWLLASRTWLAGEEMSLADFALAAHISTLDYLGDINWSSVGETRDWYARMKSRPAFRPLLGDRLVGMPASATYTDLDF
ncbi:Glutathione S-transferase family protein [hydrothermal vent metagenome]|uniref:Glutathione S-transferase family protein n=1 Tax=hydrothermal vent metagenome TaxID=652676 RepID=A0A3B0U420_9ZZZZ